MVWIFKGLLTATKIALHLYSYMYCVVKPIPFSAMHWIQGKPQVSPDPSSSSEGVGHY